MRNLVFAVLLLTALSACSDKSTLYMADRKLGGEKVGVTVTMTLNDFENGRLDKGDGTIQIVKPSGSAWAGPAGTYALTWSLLDRGNRVMVVVPSVNDSFLMDINPLENSPTAVLFGKKSYWCHDCENLRNGYGLGILPGLFIKRD
ncbi:MAG: hypothetical protein ACN6OP_09715 [Pseudomonadales bacterium]